ncbi:hypothetical protein DRJ25_02555 [Candidatus Woesearchaeota archaeon]|nr:MAG: hypothetical protein DRJ25_02555 [Candidatus Woesearchaeota archaeon]
MNWKKIKYYPAWQNTIDKEKELWISPIGNKIFYVDYIIIKKREPFEYIKIRLKKFKSKIQAINFAKNWMRKYPRGISVKI